MSQTMLLYPADASWATRSCCWVSGGESYETPEEILGKLSAASGRLSRIEILGHGAPGTASLGGASAPSTIATNAFVHHDPGMMAFWRSLRDYLHYPGLLVLNMCSAGRGDRGQKLCEELARLSGNIVCGALRTMTKEIGCCYFNDPTLYRKVLPPARYGRW